MFISIVENTVPASGDHAELLFPWLHCIICKILKCPSSWWSVCSSNLIKIDFVMNTNGAHWFDHGNEIIWGGLCRGSKWIKLHHHQLQVTELSSGSRQARQVRTSTYRKLMPPTFKIKRQPPLTPRSFLMLSFWTNEQNGCILSDEAVWRRPETSSKH